MGEVVVLTSELRAETRERAMAAIERSKNPDDLLAAVMVDGSILISFLDALERTERERDEAREVANHGHARTEGEWERRGWMITELRKRVNEAEAALTAARASLREMAKALEPITAYAFPVLLADSGWQLNLSGRGEWKRRDQLAGLIGRATRVLATYRASETGGGGDDE